jgi:thioredoxin-dependent peroxiredoxin
MGSIRYENAQYHTKGDLPTVGSRAPDIMLVNTRLQNVSLANWMNMRKIINIFVSIDTATCAQSVIRFERHGAPQEDLALLMVSHDLPFAHTRFMKEQGLNRVTGLSAIREGGFGDNYGVLIIDGPLAGMFARAVVVLDENNTVVHTEQIEDIATEPDYAAAFRALGIDIDE